MTDSTSMYAAFLRGMNVGERRLTNEELRSHFEALGFERLATFRASGNVVFAGRSRPVAKVRAEIEAGLERALGYAVPTFVRTGAEIRAIAAHTPFSPARLRASEGKLQVGFLAKPATAAQRGKLAELAGEHDALAFDGCELYWLPRGGVLDSSLDMGMLARELGAMTLRTMGTVEAIAAKHFATG